MATYKIIMKNEHGIYKSEGKSIHEVIEKVNKDFRGEKTMFCVSRNGNKEFEVKLLGETMRKLKADNERRAFERRIEKEL